MASGGSLVESATGSRTFDFGSDDVLCSFEDYTTHVDPTADGKRFHSSTEVLLENRARSPSDYVYEQLEEFSRDNVMYAVEKCMKKYADNLLTHLEGMSERLAQLELYCYKLERSIGVFRTDMIRDQSQADLKFKSLKKQVHEIHRTVQIIRDKQELTETQKELAKLQLSLKDSTDSSHSQISNERLNTPTTGNKANNYCRDVPSQKLTNALPYAISSLPPSIVITAPDKNYPLKERPVQQSVPVSLTVLPRNHHVLNQANAYYYTQPLPVEQQASNLQPEPQYALLRTLNQTTQWPSSQNQAPTIQTSPAYAPSVPNQHANIIPESHQGSCILLPTSYCTTPQSCGFGGSSSTISHLLPISQDSQGSFAPPPVIKSGDVGSSMLGYNAVYVIDGNRAAHFQSFHPGSYPQNGNVAASLVLANHPHAGLIEKAISLGYPRDQVAGAAFAAIESDQPLDWLKMQDGGTLCRAWSG